MNEILDFHDNKVIFDKQDIIYAKRRIMATRAFRAEVNLYVKTVAGKMLASPGDIIVKDENGYLAVWTPEKFEQEYEIIDSGENI